MCTVISFINIYVCTKFSFNPFSTFQDMANHKQPLRKGLWGDNSVLYRVLSWFLYSALLLTAIYLYTEFNFNPFCTFQDMAQTGNHYEKCLRRNNSINIQGRIMVLLHCPSPHCHLSINQMSFKSQR